MPLEDLLADLDYIAGWLPSNNNEAVAKGAARRAAVAIRNLANRAAEAEKRIEVHDKFWGGTLYSVDNAQDKDS